MLNDMTVGKPSKILIRFTLPLLLSTAIQQFYNMADSAIVGRLDSSTSLAMIGAAYPITLFFVAIGTGAAMGCSVVVSQLFGAKRMADLKSAIYTILISLVILGAVVGGVGMVLAGPLMNLLGVDSSLYAGARSYLMIYALGSFPMIVYNASSSIFTGLGDAKRPLYFLITSSVLNIILDIIAVGPLRMGVVGAAWATAISQLVAAVLSTGVLFGKIHEIKTDGSEKIFSVEQLKAVAIISIPSIAQQVCVAFGHTVIQIIVNRYSAPIMAGYEIGGKIMNFVYMCFNTMGTALSSFAGQNYGAKQNERIMQGYKASCVMCFALVAVVVIILEIFPAQFAGLFVSSTDENVEQVIQVAASYIRIVSIDELIVSIVIPSGGLLRGMGKIGKFFIITILDFSLRVGASFLFTYLMDTAGYAASYEGTFYAWFVGSIVDLAGLLIWIYRMRTKGELKKTAEQTPAVT